jgi:hypothetical protein
MVGMQGRIEDSSEVLLYNPGRNRDNLKGISSGGDKKWSHSGCILNMQLIGFMERFHEACDTVNSPE